MAIIKNKQLHELTSAELQKRLGELRLLLAKEKAQSAVGGSPTNPGHVAEVKKTIAKILTELNKRKKEEGETGRNLS